MRSWPKDGSGLEETGGEIEFCGECWELNESVLPSDGANGLEDLGGWASGGGTRPFPLPRTRPPPSFRPDISRIVGRTRERSAIPGDEGKPSTNAACGERLRARAIVSACVAQTSCGVGCVVARVRSQSWGRRRISLVCLGVAVPVPELQLGVQRGTLATGWTLLVARALSLISSPPASTRASFRARTSKFSSLLNTRFGGIIQK